MNHAYIDQHAIAERYLAQELSPEELRAFEEHLVDCQECGDRLLLAEMFHKRNGQKPEAPKKADDVVLRLVLYKPQRLLWIFLAAALAVPLLYVLWRLVA